MSSTYSAKKPDGGRRKAAMKVARRSIAVNVVLAAFKLFAGIFANSAAMISDAIHSISDFSTTFVVMIGIKMGSKESDEDHQYGHERMESIAALIVAFVLCAVGLWIGYDGVMNIIGMDAYAAAAPGVLALWAAGIGIVVKEALFWYVRGAAKTLNSDALMADAWHSRSDGISSIGSLIGIAGARAGFPVMDYLASIVICAFIIKVGLDIGRSAIDKITDKSCDKETVEKIRALVLAGDGVKGIERLNTRMFGNKIYVDVEIYFDGNSSLFETHDVMQHIHDEIEAKIEDVKHCMVHASPFQDK
ncbi:MAG: cation diffusion facilitator family transporter [Defluviitaleaceae bacterium]|nr:cation diffusion facilitator family transporter [Defluviitaleaceae bacterium]